MPNLCQMHRIFDHWHNIGLTQFRGRHPREFGKFVNDFAQVLGLTDYDVGILFKRLFFIPDLGREFPAPHTARRENARSSSPMTSVKGSRS